MIIAKLLPIVAEFLLVLVVKEWLAAVFSATGRRKSAKNGRIGEIPTVMAGISGLVAEKTALAAKKLAMFLGKTSLIPGD